ncbi:MULTISPECIES: GAF and ANTAR domain-containing protein [unclassified Streptomyces]|uniref:GAF and ANTAR domain-containing protein n=1 Tax=unclassified Streptomyces TaxID=2593676 RepID=UPI0022501A5A|nr:MULTISPECIES: GAF and ANTAR domain-containing protein [unclassified Streptomyces]MCX5333830.1 GAF and ANTAR domain-containing protein [Streptomyces sp. NBC_00140]MCX5363318.1 GAF and ANTAR domain-containing protein [Streptomyces sp. NBC_00124]
MHHTTRELRLAAALVEAADTLSDSFGVEDYLQRLADHCVDLLAAQAAGVMLIDGGRTVLLTGSSAHEDMAIDLLQAQHSGGPCLDTYGSGRAVPPVSIRAARAASRWPEFTERALRHDVVTTFAVPLRQSDRLFGALNVFVPTLLGEPSSGSELPMAQILADSASLGLQNNTVHSQCRTLAGQLQQALSSRVRIEQAKGMLAERWNTRADHAFMALRQYARRRRLPLDRVASAVIERSADDTELRREFDGTAGGPS